MDERDEGREAAPRGLGMDGPAFLLAQVGAYASGRFAQRLAEAGFTPPQAGILRIVALDEGINQKALAERLGILPVRLVALIDDLEGRGLVERRRSAQDRRNHALHLTDAGTEALRSIGRLAQAHQADLCDGLSDAERTQLAQLLAKVAQHHGLARGVHPGFRRL